MRSPEKRARGAGAVGWTVLARARGTLGRLEDGRSAAIVLAGAMALYAALALYLTRGTTLFVDELNLFSVSRGLHPGALLTPLNGHLVLTQRLMYAVDFQLFGAHSFLLPRLVEVVGVVISIGLLQRLLARRVGSAAALAGCVLLLFFGTAWELNLVPSGIGNVYAVLFGLGALLSLEGEHDGAACALLIGSVASFTLGVAFCAGALVLVLLSPNARRRAWLALVPLILWGAWLLWVKTTRTDGQAIDLWNLLLVPNYYGEVGSSLAGALSGLNYNFYGGDFLAPFTTQSRLGPVLAVLAVAALVLRLRRVPATPWLWATLAILGVFWAELGVGFGLGRNPDTARYTYGGAFFALLLAAEAARGIRISPPRLAWLYLAMLLALCANLIHLRDGERFFRGAATSLRARLTAVELARDHVSAGFTAPGSALQVITAGPYLQGVDRNGSPAYTPAELMRRPAGDRGAADAVLAAALNLGLRPSPSGAPQPRNCRRAGGSFTTSAPGVVLFASGAAQVLVGRFAPPGASAGSLPAGRRTNLAIQPDRSRLPWRVSLIPAPAQLTVCDLP